jgi:mRNA interferase MazF
MQKPSRGDVWMTDLDSTGNHGAGTRPALVISADIFNSGPAGLVLILPLTGQRKGVRSHVPIAPPEGGLHKQSFIKCEDVRSVALERLSKRLGSITPATMQAVDLRLRILMGL